MTSWTAAFFSVLWHTTCGTVTFSVEKLNGRGYPRKLTAADIPIQSRMMTVSDIYDALTASDRPYKRAVPTERALDILRMEMNDGLLDPALVNTFIDAKVYERAGVLRT